MRKYFTFFLAVFLCFGLFVACENPTDPGNDPVVPIVPTEPDPVNVGTVPADTGSRLTDAETGTKDVTTLGLTNPVIITYAASGVTIDNQDSSKVTVTTSGNDVTATATAAGVTYVLQGAASDASFKVGGNFDCSIYLNGLSIAKDNKKVINIGSNGTATITLVDGTKNDLQDTTATADTEGKNVLVSDGALTITGNGELNIVTRDLKTHGIAAGGTLTIGAAGGGAPNPKITASVYGNGSKALKSNNMVIQSGTLSLGTIGNAYYSVDDDDVESSAGIKTCGTLTISGGVITILSNGTGGKGISADGDITISGGTIDVGTSGATSASFTLANGTRDDTSAKAIKSDTNLTITGGDITIKTTKDGAEGLEAEFNVTISGGNLNINTYDDAINASGGDTGNAGLVAISGGTIFCNASNNDGSNGKIHISGGTIISCGAQTP